MTLDVILDMTVDQISVYREQMECILSGEPKIYEDESVIIINGVEYKGNVPTTVIGGR